MRTECLLQGNSESRADIEVRFLQLYERDSWQEAVERTLHVCNAGIHTFQFDAIEGDIEVVREALEPRLYKLRITITNRSALDEGRNPLLQCLVSTHTILSIHNGAFISLLDPPDEFRQVAASCKNVATWPVLIGKEPERDCILSSPIILYDYPRVADESPGDLFDSTEIDEILTLRILTLTEAEKDEMRRSGERERELLERVESLRPEEFLKLHGTMRDLQIGLKRGDRVRIHPRNGGDIFDVVLAGRIAIVESLEKDFEDRTHVAVVIEDDPGKDLGLMRQPGHRFFFSADELELVS
jgi:hypothetical protein